MTDTIMIKLTDVTESATVDQLKYWCKLLDIQPKIISRAAHVTTEQCEMIKKMADLISQGVKPKEAAGLLVNNAVTISPVNGGEREQELVSRIESLEKAVLLLVEQNKRLTATIEMQNEMQNRKLEAIQMRLEPPKVEPVVVKVWEPAPKRKPQYSFLQKFWYELIDPVKLRAI